MNNRITISFLPKRDQDLMKFIETKKDGNLSEYIRQLIRDDMEGKSKKYNDNEEVIAQILDKIGGLEGKRTKDGDFIEDSLTKDKVEDVISNLF